MPRARKKRSQGLATSPFEEGSPDTNGRILPPHQGPTEASSERAERQAPSETECGQQLRGSVGPDIRKRLVHVVDVAVVLEFVVVEVEVVQAVVLEVDVVELVVHRGLLHLLDVGRVAGERELDGERRLVQRLV